MGAGGPSCCTHDSKSRITCNESTQTWGQWIRCMLRFRGYRGSWKTALTWFVRRAWGHPPPRKRVSDQSCRMREATEEIPLYKRVNLANPLCASVNPDIMMINIHGENIPFAVTPNLRLLLSYHMIIIIIIITRSANPKPEAIGHTRRAMIMHDYN